MSVIYLALPIALILVGAAFLAFRWSVFSGQLDAGSEAVQRGAQGFVGKPFDLRALIEQTKQIVPA